MLKSKEFWVGALLFYALSVVLPPSKVLASFKKKTG
jgi:hypothetical protein